MAESTSTSSRPAHTPEPPGRPVRRTRGNVLVVLGLVGLFVAMAAGLVYLQRSLTSERADRVRAEANFESAREAVVQMVAATRHFEEPEDASLRALQQQQFRAATNFLERMASQQGSDPRIRFEAAGAGMELARLQDRLGLHGQMMASLSRSEETLRELHEQDAENVDYRVRLAECYELLADHRAQPLDRHRCLEQALILTQDLAQEFPRRPEMLPRMARVLSRLGDWYYGAGRPGDAEYFYRSAEFALVRQTRRGTELQRPGRICRATIRSRLCQIYYGTGQSEDADRYREQARDELDELLAADETDLECLLARAKLHYIWATALAARDTSAEALAELTESEKMLVAARKRERQSVAVREQLLETYRVRAALLEKADRLQEALADRRHALELVGPEQRDSDHLLLAMTLARAGLAADALTEVRALEAGLSSLAPTEQEWQLVRVAAVAEAAVAKNAGLPETERARQAAEARSLGMRLLARVRAAIPDARWTANWHKAVWADDSLRPFHQDDQFRKLVGDPPPADGE